MMSQISGPCCNLDIEPLNLISLRVLYGKVTFTNTFRCLWRFLLLKEAKFNLVSHISKVTKYILSNIAKRYFTMSSFHFSMTNEILVLVQVSSQSIFSFRFDPFIVFSWYAFLLRFCFVRSGVLCTAVARWFLHCYILKKGKTLIDFSLL